MAFLIDRPVRLDEGIIDALKKLGKGPIEKIKDKLTDAAAEQIEYYSKTSLSKMVDDETKESIEDDITDIFTSMIDSIFDLSESEEEFDAEGDRYEELRSRLLGGRTMKYEEMEELLAAAKARNDQKVVGALKNVVDDPPTDAVTESSAYVKDDDDLKAADDKLWNAIDRLVELKDLTADECEWDGAGDELILTYRGIDWDEGNAASAFGPNKGGWFAEGIKDDVESDLIKIRCVFLSSSGFDLEIAQDSVQTAIDDASETVRKDGKDAISRKENELGEWECTADCVVRIPCRLTYGPMRAMSEDDETGRNSIASAAADRLLEGGFDVDVESPTVIRLNGGKTADEDEITSMLSDLGICAQEVSPGVFELDWTDPVAGITDEIEEKEELLPDCVVNEAIETLRRMY